jgi:hypothetical protein
VHVPKDKRTKLDPSGKKGTFVGYSDTSKAYRVYIPGHRKIEISRDVTFDEDVSFHKSKQGRAEESHDEENGVPRAAETREVEAEESIPEDQDMAKPQRPVEKPTQKRRPLGHKRPSKMQRDMVPRMDHLGKSRNQNRIPTMWHYCVISLM